MSRWIDGLTRAEQPMRHWLVAGVALLSIGMAAPLAAQSWVGNAGLGVEVSDRSGRAIEGAQVTLVYLAADGGGPATVATDSRGRAEVTGLAEGRWAIDVRHPSFLGYAADVVLRSGKKPKESNIARFKTGDSLESNKIKLFKVDAPRRSANHSRADRRPSAPVAATPQARPRTPPAPTSGQTSEQPAQPQSVSEPAKPTTNEPETSPASEPAVAPPEPDPESSQAEPAPAPIPGTPPTPQPQPTPPSKQRPVPTPPTVERPSDPAPTMPAPAPKMPTPESEPAEPEPADVEAPPTVVTTSPSAVPPGPQVERMPEVESAPLTPPAAQPWTPPQSTSTVPAIEPLGPMLRSYRDGTCAECQAGEWAAASEGWAPAATADSSSACPSDLAERVRRAARRVATAAPRGFAAYAGALNRAGSGAFVGRAGVGAMGAAQDLAPHLGPDSGCQVVAVKIPAGAKVIGFRFEAADATGVGDCLPGEDCPIGDAAWASEAVVVRTEAGAIIAGLFENRSAEHNRQPRLTAFFIPASNWSP